MRSLDDALIENGGFWSFLPASLEMDLAMRGRSLGRTQLSLTDHQPGAQVYHSQDGASEADRLFPLVRWYDTRVVVRSLRLQNFRSFVDTGTIELRPLMVLVGANSAGKSSFLRFFPLLKQTAEAPSSGPLLWYGGPGRYVDFGDFGRVVRRGSAERNIDLTFELPSRITMDKVPISVSIQVTMCERESKTSVSRLILKMEGDTCELRLDEGGQVKTCLLNDTKMETLVAVTDIEKEQQALVYWSPGSLLPRFLMNSLWPIIEQQLLNDIGEMVHGRSTPETKAALVAELPYWSLPEQFHQALLKLEGGRYWKKTLKSSSPQGTRIKRMRLLVFLRKVVQLLDDAGLWLSEFARSVSYIGPFRKDPVRFDRLQGLSVQQLDPRGDNLAMFLLALSSNDREDFDRWAAHHFGFGIKVDSTPSHVSVLIHDGKEAFNLIDMGYGLSQVLPVIAQCWLASKQRPVGRRPAFFSIPALTAIEQPELHLHPRYQARLADLFVGVIQASKAVSAVAPSTQLVIETHSESMISRLGELVSLGKLNSKDCSVLLFQKESTGNTTVRTAEFNEDGMLSEWPVGFLSA